MKIDRSKLKKNSSDAPGDCGWLIEKLRTCTDEELCSVLCLSSLETWNYGKCELHHWVDVLDRFDGILQAATERIDGGWVLACNLPENHHMHELVIWVLHFTTLLVEHSFSRHLYSSVEHLIRLLSSSSMSIVLAVLNLLYMFSKRSNFITRIAAGSKEVLLSRLINLAESWGGKENGYGLAVCCKDLPLSSFPRGSTTLHYEFYKENVQEDSKSPVHSKYSTSTQVIHVENVESLGKNPAEFMEELIKKYNVPPEKQVDLYTHLRLACNFGHYETRLLCVQARLQAMSILVYCMALAENAYTVLYSGLLEEFVDVLELQDPRLTEIKAATLRTLTSIIHLERQTNFPKLTKIIDVTGAGSYHGFLPALVRSCIASLTASTPPEPNPFPAPLATSLFSFLYHLASYETGGDALVSCGMMESLLTVVGWIGTEPDHITFVTRAVRVIDLITNLDMNAFQTHGGLNAFIKRLEFEVDQCRKDQPFVIQIPSSAEATQTSESQVDADMPSAPSDDTQESAMSPMDIAASSPIDQASATGHLDLLAEASTSHATKLPDYSQAKTTVTCLPQRAALLKSMLNFLKKDIQDPGFSESMRHLMEGSLPYSLKHIISNAEYYGPSLFLLATDVVTVYVFGEPSLLSSLQDNGLTDVVLHALLIKDVPATKEVLGSLPNVFSALCLNSRGLESFVVCKPFQRLFKVLLSPDYLPAMRRRRSSEPMGDTASNLGTAMDELMRHQPSLKSEAMKAIVMLLQEVNKLGHDSHYVCWTSSSKNEPCQAAAPHTTSENSSDEEEEEEDESGNGVANSALPGVSVENAAEDAPAGDKRPVPLVDYVLNVMKFVDAILSNNSTDDHCKEFVTQKGLVPLLGILGLPNLPIDFAVSQACQSVSSVCKSILNLAHENNVLMEGLVCLDQHLDALVPLHQPIPYPGGSVLLRELASSTNPQEAVNSAQSTPLLHTLSAIHSYITMLVLVCRTSQQDIRQIAVKQWATTLGERVLIGLSQLYTTLVAESTILFAICSEDGGSGADKDDTNKEPQPKAEGSNQIVGTLPMDIAELDAASFSPLTRYSFSGGPFDAASNKAISSQQQLKLFKPLLSTASRLGKSLAELFSLLVKLCVGSPLRQRRGQQIPPVPSSPTPAAISVASALSHVLYNGLSWTPTPPSTLAKFRRTYLVCSIRFSSPMLFDDKKMPYHLMINNFARGKGLAAFFDTFDWALSTTEDKESSAAEGTVDAEDISEGMGEFLDTWLYLLEKLVNPKTMLESPHSSLSKKDFCPLKFLIYIQKQAFHAVMKLWNRKPVKTYGVKISEAVLVILCYIIKGETIIGEKLAKEKAVAEAEAAAAAPSTSTSQAVPMELPSTAESFPMSIQQVSPMLDIGAALGPLPPPATPASTMGERTGQILRHRATRDNALSGDGADTPTDLSFQINSLSNVESIVEAPVDPSTPPANPPVSGEDVVIAESPAQPLPPVQAPETADLWLQPLLDMGFPQDRCLEAIERYDTLEGATDFLLSHPSLLAGESDMSFTDDQWVHAVSLSMDAMHSSYSKPSASEPSTEPLFANEEPLCKTKLDEFCADILEGCLDQLHRQPQLVYKVCEVLTTCVTRNGFEWQQKLLTTLMDQLIEQALELQVIASQSSCHDTANYLCVSDTSAKFGVRLHLVTLLFEEMKSGCAAILEKSRLPEFLIDLICSTEVVMSNNPQMLSQLEAANEEKKRKDKLKDTKSMAFTWLAPSMLLLDIYEKFSVAQSRRVDVQKITDNVWKWFDVGAVRWYGYGLPNNKLINDAYWAGESSVRIINGRRKYTIQFSNMLQVNEETWNRRPIMLCIRDDVIAEHKANFIAQLPTSKAQDTKDTTTTQPPPEHEDTEQPLELTKKAKSVEKMDYDLPQTEDKKKNQVSLVQVPCFTDTQQDRMVRACVGFMKLCVEPDTLHALMRLCLRMTRTWTHASLFSSLGGVRILLGLTEKSSFWGFQTLAALLMRHVLEEPATLMNAMKKVLRYTASNTAGMRAKEMHSLLRSLAPAACRNSKMFGELTQTYLRIDLNMATAKRVPNNQNGEEESLLMRTVGTKTSTSTSLPVSEVESDKTEPQQLISDLLEALTQEVDEPTAANADPSWTKPASEATSIDPRDPSYLPPVPALCRHMNLSRSSSANDMVVQDMDEQSPMESEASKLPGNESKSELDEQPTKMKTLLTKSVVCKLLAEFVRSYSGVAKLITEHQFVGGITPNIKEDCSALSHLLDLLITGSDVELANHIRVLVAALSSCNHSVDAQTVLVTEVKNSLSKIVSLPENGDKHTKVQAIVGLVGTMMESCPAQVNPPMNHNYPKQQPGMNNVVRIMIKKNLIIDLARIPHCLDLASPNLAATVNVLLKPLETVLRLANTPTIIPVSNPKKKGSNSEGSHQQSENLTTNSEATRAQGDDNAEDPENTEHDLSGPGESLEPSSDANPNEDVTLGVDETGLDEILGQMLADETGSVAIANADDTIRASVTYVIDDDTPMDTDDTLHDSRMVSHSDSQFLDENDPNNDDDDDDSSDSSEDDRDEAEENEEVEDEDDEDDDDDDAADEDDDEEEEEEEGSVFDEGYEDLEEAYLHMPTERDNPDDLLFLPSYQRYISTIDTIIFGDRFALSQHNNPNSNSHFSNEEGPLLIASSPNSSSADSASVPPHPLFQNPRDVINAQGRLVTRPGGGRARGLLRYHTVNSRNTSTTTNILQRLLGQTHREVLQLTSNLREVFIANPEGRYPIPEAEELDAGESGVSTTATRTASGLPSVPNALSRWMEEAKVLETDSMHDAVIQIKPMVMSVLEYYKEIEQTERDKKKKEQEALKKTEPKAPKAQEAGDGATQNVSAVSSIPSPVDPTALISVSTPSITGPTTTSTANLMLSVLEEQQLVSSGIQTASVLTPPTFTGAGPTSLPGPTTATSVAPAPAFTGVLSQSYFGADPLGSSGLSVLSQDMDAIPTQSSILEYINREVSAQSTPRAAAMTRTISTLDSSAPPFVPSTYEYSSRSPQQLAMSTLSLIAEQPGTTQPTDEAMCVSPPAETQQAENTPVESMDQDGTAVPAQPIALAPEPVEATSDGATGSAEGASASSSTGTTRVSNEYAAILGDIEIPEGVDPSFLAALPEDMRQEVIAEQLRIQQVRRASEALQQHTSEAITEVSPEFLAALPPNIQEELLTHQRQEQERQEDARTVADDPAAFIQNLPANLRETVLSDIEETQLTLLPPDVVEEATRLRHQRGRDNRQSRDTLRGSGSSISHILRNTARFGSRFFPSNSWPNWNLRTNSSSNAQTLVAPNMRGQQVLDHEAVSCLLILLFIDEPRINTARLHRVIKFLCYYQPTRQWIVKTLLSIIERCGNQSLSDKSDFSPVTSASGAVDKERPLSTPSWLSMGIDTALGLKTSIFQLYKSSAGGKRTPSSGSNTVVLIHNLAAPLVCRHAVDLLISLAKVFPVHFLPTSKECDELNDGTKRPSGQASTSTGAIPKTKSNSADTPDFWEILMKLDSISVSRKSKSVPKAHINTSTSAVAETDVEMSIETSPLGELVSQLSHPVIRRSSLLTDKLLRLLALVSVRLPETQYYSQKGPRLSEASIKGIEKLVNLAIQVLTSKSCSEEGLEDVTGLLLNLANGPAPAWELVLKLLLQGATTLGQTVTGHIGGLLSELQKFNVSHPSVYQPDETPSTSSDKNKKGILKDRFTKEEVIVTPNSKTKQPCEIQLPSMASLTAKTSSQAFFLRTLKVIIQLRDNVRLARKKEKASRLVAFSEARALPVVAEEALPRDNEMVSESTSEEQPSGASAQPSTQPMEVSPAAASVEAMDVDQDQDEHLKSLSSELGLDDLWSTLSRCLIELGETPDTHAVLVLQPAVEAFFLVHAFAASTDKKTKSSTNQETREAQLAHLEKEIAPLSPLPASGEDETSQDKSKASTSEADTVNDDANKFLSFAEMHRSVLNQILRQSTVHLADGPFRVLVDHTRLLDFDIKRKYFRTELERADEGMRKEDLAVHVRRENVFEDSFREIQRRSPEEWKNRFYIVFEGEEGQDAGGLLREWYVIISREIFNPMYALFCTSPGDRVTYMINQSSHCNSNHLSYFKFVGRVIAKAIYDNKLLECYFTRSFYKHILGKMVRVADMESEDYTFYQGLIYLIEHRVVDMGYDISFSTDVQEFGVTEVRDLKPDGRNIPVTESTKMEYIRLVCQEKMTGAIRKQLNAFLEGFYDIIPKRLISIFNEQELELLVSGLPTIDIDDLKNNTEYHKYNPNSLQIQWFWRALRSFDQAERAKLVQFVTGTSKVPLQGFGALEGMNGVQKFQIHKDERSTDRLPSAHTCFNQLDLPVYETYDKLRHYLLKAIVECSEGFGFA